MRPFALKKCKRVHGLYFTSDGSHLLVVGAPQVDVVESVIWLDLASGKTVRRLDKLAACYALSADLSRLALGGCHDYDEGPAIQWTTLPDGANWLPLANPGTRDKKNPIFNHVFGLAFDPTGTRLAVSHGEQYRRTADLGEYEWEFGMIVMQVDPPKVIRRIGPDEGGGSGAGVLSFNPAGTRLAASGGWEGDPVVSVYAQPSAGRVCRFTPPGTRTRGLLFLPDGRLAVANARNLYVCPPDSAEAQFVLGGHKGQVNAVASAPDGKRLLTAAHDGAIRVWDADTGAPGPAFDWGIGPVTAVAFAPDGLTCAAAGTGGKIVTWDADG